MCIDCNNCGWSQDDFWSFKISKYGYWRITKNIKMAYSPFSYLMSLIWTNNNSYLIPRRLNYDSDIVKERGWSRSDIHSWYIVWTEFIRIFKRIKSQRWFTYKSFKRDYSKGIGCPECGSMDINID